MFHIEDNWYFHLYKWIFAQWYSIASYNWQMYFLLILPLVSYYYTQLNIEYCSLAFKDKNIIQVKFLLLRIWCFDKGLKWNNCCYYYYYNAYPVIIPHMYNLFTVYENNIIKIRNLKIKKYLLHCRDCSS